MFSRLSALALGIALFVSAAGTRAQDKDKDKDVKPAPSKVTAVTVYATTALVTREVTVPDAAGLNEVVVSPLPPFTMQSSLYAEGNDNIRVLSVRYRTRAIAEDTREEVRKIEAEIKTLQGKAAGFEADLKAAAENLKLLDKLEGFTAKSLEHLTDKGQLDPEKIITLAKRGLKAGEMRAVNARRIAAARLSDSAAVKKLFDDYAPRYAERPGGYTRIMRLGLRLGDAAEMVLLEFVEE